MSKSLAAPIFDADVLQDADSYDVDAYDADAEDDDAYDHDAYDADACDGDAYDADAQDTDVLVSSGKTWNSELQMLAAVVQIVLTASVYLNWNQYNEAVPGSLSVFQFVLCRLLSVW